MTTVIKLKPGETMAQYRARVRLDMEAGVVATVVRCNPGIRSKDAISAMTGFTPERVEVILTALNRNETPYSRIDYGTATPKAGPWAGEWRTGWYPMDVAAYQQVGEQADWHSMRVEAGLRVSRIYRKLFFLGCTTSQAAKTVRAIEERMKVPVDQLTDAEADRFVKLAEKQGAEFIRNGSF